MSATNAGRRGSPKSFVDAETASSLLNILRLAGAPPGRALNYLRDAQENGTTIQQEILLDREVDQNRYFEALAREIGLGFLNRIDGRRLVPVAGPLASQMARAADARLVGYRQANGDLLYLVSPDLQTLPALRNFSMRHGAFAAHVAVVPSEVLRAAILSSSSHDLLGISTNELFLNQPAMSARATGAMPQGLAIGLIMAAVPVGFFLAPSITMAFVHLASSVFFLSCVAVRLLAYGEAGTRKISFERPMQTKDLPVYTVLVALYREEEVVGQLLVALGRLRWPRAKLDIKLVCEADDEATIDAIRLHEPLSSVELVIVPPGGPRTKPNALAYALKLARGEFVVLYDAEDRPHPDQLLEAYALFSRSGPEVACLQAPLVVANWSHNVLSALFAFEYAALFRGLLPWLASRKLIIPLGGTSNHFRREALSSVFGWDPYNVTEDADLGMRLARLGYRTGVINAPTLEDAPEDLTIWIRQRTRWFKGWMQTALVHFRNVKRTYQELKLRNFIISQIIFAGIIISAMIHPVSLLLVAFQMSAIMEDGAVERFELLAILDFFSITTAYITFHSLGRKALSPHERRHMPVLWPYIPLYWFGLSLAAWRAFWQLLHDPHGWEKTPHSPARNSINGFSTTPQKPSGS